MFFSNSCLSRVQLSVLVWCTGVRLRPQFKSKGLTLFYFYSFSLGQQLRFSVVVGGAQVNAPRGSETKPVRHRTSNMTTGSSRTRKTQTRTLLNTMWLYWSMRFGGAYCLFKVWRGVTLPGWDVAYVSDPPQTSTVTPADRNLLHLKPLSVDRLLLYSKGPPPLPVGLWLWGLYCCQPDRILLCSTSSDLNKSDVLSD